MRRHGLTQLPVGLAFEPLAFAEALAVGDLGEVTESEYGFHIVQRVG